jgi:hypothetical protein
MSAPLQRYRNNHQRQGAACNYPGEFYDAGDEPYRAEQE